MIRTIYRGEVKECYAAIYSELKPEMIITLDNLLSHPDKGDKSTWSAIKREPKKLTPNNVKNFVTHLHWLKALTQGMPSLTVISSSKTKQFSIEAKSLDISMMNALKPQKRYTLAVVPIHTQVAKALDDMAETFIRLIQKLHYKA